MESYNIIDDEELKTEAKILIDAMNDISKTKQEADE